MCQLKGQMTNCVCRLLTHLYVRVGPKRTDTPHHIGAILDKSFNNSYDAFLYWGQHEMHLQDNGRHFRIKLRRSMHLLSFLPMVTWPVLLVTCRCMLYNLFTEPPISCVFSNESLPLIGQVGVCWRKREGKCVGVCLAVCLSVYRSVYLPVGLPLMCHAIIDV